MNSTVRWFLLIFRDDYYIRMVYINLYEMNSTVRWFLIIFRDDYYFKMVSFNL